MPSGRSSAFVSYCRVDSEFAVRLTDDLKQAGEDVWLDQEDIHPGELWDVAVERALVRCPCLLVILSPTSVASSNVLDEVSFALKKRKTIIPVLYQDCEIPFRLDRFQYIDFRNDYARALKSLLKVLGEEVRPEVAFIQATPAVPSPHHSPTIAVPEPVPPPPGSERNGELQQEGVESSEGVALNILRSESLASPKENGRSQPIPLWTKVLASALVTLLLASLMYWTSHRTPSNSRTGDIPAHTSPDNAELGGSRSQKKVEAQPSMVQPTASLPAKAQPQVEAASHIAPSPVPPEQPKDQVLGVSPSPMEQSVKSASTGPNRLRIENDFAQATKACEAGQAKACYDEAQELLRGRVAPKNEAKYVELTQKACDLQYGKACGQVGSWYAFGKEGIPQNTVVAQNYLQNACNFDPGVSCVILGKLFESGTIVPQDFGNAARVFEIACMHNLPYACCDLELLYRDGRVVAPSQAKAEEMHVKCINKTPGG